MAFHSSSDCISSSNPQSFHPGFPFTRSAFMLGNSSRTPCTLGKQPESFPRVSRDWTLQFKVCQNLWISFGGDPDITSNALTLSMYARTVSLLLPVIGFQEVLSTFVAFGILTFPLLETSRLVDLIIALLTSVRISVCPPAFWQGKLFLLRVFFISFVPTSPR